jgi:p24 family protein alpha
VSQKGASSGRFTFSAADSGQHRLCFTASTSAANPGWLSGGAPTVGAVKLTLDMAIGETSEIESKDKGKIDEIVVKVMDLNGRLRDIQREQIFQRVSSPLLFILQLLHRGMEQVGFRWTKTRKC